MKTWNEKKEKEEPLLRLIKDSNGDIDLIVCDGEGVKIKGGTILSIRPDGTLFRAECINPKTGLALDSYGRIKLAK